MKVSVAEELIEAMSRANASNSTPIVAETLIWSSVQTYDSSGFRPLSGGTHGCDYSCGFDEEAFGHAERSSCPCTNTTSGDRHCGVGHLRDDWQARGLPGLCAVR